MFSIIIPLYNKGPYVEKAIWSVLNQTYKEFELIVVDDGSTDNSVELVKNIQLSTFNIQLLTQQNQGVSTARNNGVKAAKYPYICFLDADDWWAPIFLEEMKGLIEDFPTAGIYGSAYYKVKNGKNIRANIGVDKVFEKGVINYFQVYAKTMWMPLTSISVVLPKTIYVSEGGFKPQLKLGEDFDLWVRIAVKYPVVFFNKPLAYYNQDVEFSQRAVGSHFYKPEEHMLFSNYGILNKDADFVFLYERLAVYSLLPYFLANQNTKEVKAILKGIDWNRQEFRYFFYYRICPKNLLRLWFFLLKIAVDLKSKFNYN